MVNFIMQVMSLDELIPRYRLVDKPEDSGNSRASNGKSGSDKMVYMHRRYRFMVTLTEKMPSKMQGKTAPPLGYQMDVRGRQLRVFVGTALNNILRISTIRKFSQHK